jgi:hypothetical protein
LALAGRAAGAGLGGFIRREHAGRLMNSKKSRNINIYEDVPMPSFAITVRDTVIQAVLPGFSDINSHAGNARDGIYLWQDVNEESFAPYFHIGSTGIIFSVAG